MAKRRIDALLVERGLAESQEKAQAAVLAGSVLVEQRPAAKPGVLVDEAAELTVVASPRYVSRGGDKLEHALRAFGLDVRGLAALDVGASTGGFTDCLLQHGAARVYAVDVGYGQLHYRLRQDSRVVAMERVNARHLVSLPEKVDVATVDVSFISLEKVLPAVSELLALGGKARLKPGLQSARGRGSIVALFKPQFEARPWEVERGGVVRDPLLLATLLGRFAVWAVGQGYRIQGLTRSPLLGPAGNQEFFFLLRPPSEGS